MAVAAAVTVYRQQFVAAFEQRSTPLKAMTTKETMRNGNSVKWLISGSGSDTAVTRGTNGQIPYGTSTNTTVDSTLTEQHAPYEMTGFNIFSSQGDQKQIMQMNSMAVINRTIEDEIIEAISNGTNDTSTAATMSLALVMKARSILRRNNVDITNPNDVFGLLSPAAEAYLSQIAQFTSKDYVSIARLDGSSVNVLRWAGVNWYVSNRVEGVGTNAEKCAIWHRASVGYACNVGEESVMLGYDEKQDTSWTRATIYHDAQLLQNGGVVIINHDGSAYEAA